MATIVDMTARRLPADGYIYKHSTVCPISARTGQLMQAVTLDAPVYWINVIEQRGLSNWIAAKTGIRHESPQLLRFRGGKVDRVWSHFAIDEKAILDDA